MAGPVDSSTLASLNANLQSQLAASQVQAKNEDPDGIFEMITELFNQFSAFVVKVVPDFMKVSGTLSTGLDAHAKLEPAAPVPSTKPVMPGTMSAQGGVLAKSFSKVFNFKNLFNGLSAPTIEALAALGETMLNVSWSDLGGLSPQSFAGVSQAQDVGMSGAGFVG